MKTKRPKVFTFYSPNIPDIASAQKRLIAWRDNWSAAGYDPIAAHAFKVATDRSVKPYLDRLSSDASGPSFLKWFSVAVACPIDEFCIFADYNVFNYSFVPDMNAGRLTSKNVNVFYAPGTSDVIFAGKTGLMRQCDMFCHYTPAEGQHFTDLDVLKHQEVNMPELSASIDVLRTFGDDGWLTASLVRFPESCDPKALRDWTATKKTVEVVA